MYYWNDGTDYLAHHGVPKQKWGVRRYQNLDGSLTPLGRERLGLKGCYRNGKHVIDEDKEDRLNGQRWGAKGRDDAIASAARKAKNTISSTVAIIKRKSEENKIKREEERKKAELNARMEKARKAKEEKALAEKKAAEEAAAAEAKKKEESEAREKERLEKEAEIERIVRSGTYEEVLANIGNMTKSQRDDVLDRFNKVRSLAEAKRETPTKLDNAFNTVKKVSDYANTATNAWNNFVKISNSLAGTSFEEIGSKVQDKDVAAMDSFIRQMIKDGKYDELYKEMGNMTAAQLKTISSYYGNRNEAETKLSQAIKQQDEIDQMRKEGKSEAEILKALRK